METAVVKLKERKALKEDTPRRQGKFNASPKEGRTWRGRVYDSKLEMKMHQELLEHFPEEYVHLQSRFLLQPSFCLDHSSELQRALIYRSDFTLGEVFVDEQGFSTPGRNCMILDAKGMVLPSFVVAAKLLEYKYRMPVLAVKTVKQLKVYIETHKKSMEINQQHLDILTSNTPFRVRHYTDSTGTVSDLLVRVIGREGYRELVKRSHEELSAAAELVLAKAGDEEASGHVAAALEKIAASLTKSMNAVEEEGAARQAKNEVIHPITPDVIMVDSDPAKLAVLRLEVLEQTVISGPVEGKVNKNATYWRRRVEQQLPLSRYRHRLNLYPGKFLTLEPA